MTGPERRSKYTITFQQVRLISGMAADAVGASDYVCVAFTTVMIAYQEVNKWVGIEMSAKATHVIKGITSLSCEAFPWQAGPLWYRDIP